MSKRYAMACIMIVGLGLGSTPALARDHGHDRDHDRDDRKESRERGYGRDRHNGRGDHDRDHDRNGEPRAGAMGKKKVGRKTIAICLLGRLRNAAAANRGMSTTMQS